MPWLDPETLGPFRPGDYFYSYFAVALLTLVVMGAFCFALATITRSMFGTHIGLIAMLMTYFVSAAFFTRPEFERIVAVLRHGLSAGGGPPRGRPELWRRTQADLQSGHSARRDRGPVGTAREAQRPRCWVKGDSSR
jgi:hypothetical protein